MDNPGSIRGLSQQLHTAKVAGFQDVVDSLEGRIDAIKQVELNKLPKPSPVAANAILNDEEASPIDVFEFLNQSLGKEWPEWEMETIEHMLFTDYAFALEDTNRDKLYALKVLATCDEPFEEWYVFNQCATSITGHGADFYVFKKTSPAMCLVALTTMKHIHPDKEVNLEVGRFICLVFNDSGIYTPPPSHFDTLKDDMERLVSEDVRKIWQEAILLYSSYLKEEIKEFPETAAGIQALRLMNAESAHEEILR